MLWIIPSNFLKIGNGWAIVEKYAPTVVLVEAHFFPQFLENFRFHSNATSTLIFLEKKTRIYWIWKGLIIPPRNVVAKLIKKRKVPESDRFIKKSTEKWKIKLKIS